MKYFYLFIMLIGLVSCKDFSAKAQKDLLEKLNGSWETTFNKTNAKYSRLHFVNDSTVICSSKNNRDTLFYNAGIQSVRLYPEEEDMIYFFVKEIDEEHLTLIEDVSDKSEEAIYYKRSSQ